MNALSAMDIYVKAKYNKPEQLSETVGNALNNEFKAAGARYSLFRRVEYRYRWNFMMSRNPDIYLFRALFLFFIAQYARLQS